MSASTQRQKCNYRRDKSRERDACVTVAPWIQQPQTRFAINFTLTNLSHIKIRQANLLVPTLPQLLPVYHWPSNSNCDGQPPDRQHELSLVEALAQNVERVRRRDPAPKQVKPIGENQRSRLQECRGSDYLLDTSNLNRESLSPEER